MITPKQAEQRAQAIVEEFVNAAECRDANDVANVLMKLASMAGLAMAAVVGRDEATMRMHACVLNVSNATVVKVPVASFSVAGTSQAH